MLTIDEALARVLSHARQLAPERVRLGSALGHVLAEDVTSDVDSPPHDKSTVDGYAILAADLVAGRGEFSVIEQVVAGAVPSHAVTPGSAIQIMTGAPLPAGADAVVMIERTEMLPERPLPCIRIDDTRCRSGQNIVRQGASLRCGEIVLERGHMVRSIEIGLLAEVGRGEVDVIRLPQVAVLATGNELVPLDQVPGPGQIRNSNEPLLAACVARAGGIPRPLGIAVDQPAELRRLIAAGLESDVLVVAGGVSAGVLDLVPGVLAELGVEQVFHKVNIKPGMPLWFGILPGQPAAKLVFGLPGNPVSSYVCFELFVRPALARMAGREEPVWFELRRSWRPNIVTRADGRRSTRPSIARRTAGRWSNLRDIRVPAICEA